MSELFYFFPLDKYLLRRDEKQTAKVAAVQEAKQTWGCPPTDVLRDANGTDRSNRCREGADALPTSRGQCWPTEAPQQRLAETGRANGVPPGQRCWSTGNRGDDPNAPSSHTGKNPDAAVNLSLPGGFGVSCLREEKPLFLSGPTFETNENKKTTKHCFTVAFHKAANHLIAGIFIPFPGLFNA